MIQDIQPKKLNNQYDPSRMPKSDSPVLHLLGRKLFCRLDGQTISFPTYEQVFAAAGFSEEKMPGINTPKADLIYLFEIDGEDYFLLRRADSLSIEGFDYSDISVYGKSFPQDRSFAAITAFHLNNWYESEKYCGHCGTELVLDSKERMMKCPECGNMIFPRINPCVIVGVFYDGKILCTQYNRPNAGRFALVAGFAEIGETIEDTVRREVMEEVGLKVKNLTFYKSQPWGMSSSLLHGFLCEAESGDFHVDGVELASAHWFSREELLECYTPSHVALTSNIITRFMRGEIGPESIIKTE